MILINRPTAGGERRLCPRSATCCTCRASDVGLSRAGGIPEPEEFQRHLSEYRIVVYSGLQCDNIMFDGQVPSVQRISLLYDGQYYHVITNPTADMIK